jgi:hypothetical protein
MSLTLLMTALAALAAAPEPPKSARECRRHDLQQATRGIDPPPSPRRLDQLPPGNLELAVQRQVDGCIEPTIIRYGVGAPRR